MRSTSNLKDAIKNDAPVVRDELSNNLCFDWELGNSTKTQENLNSSYQSLR